MRKSCTLINIFLHVRFCLSQFFVSLRNDLEIYRCITGYFTWQIIIEYASCTSVIICNDPSYQSTSDYLCQACRFKDMQMMTNCTRAGVKDMRNLFSSRWLVLNYAQYTRTYRITDSFELLGCLNGNTTGQFRHSYRYIPR